MGGFIGHLQRIGEHRRNGSEFLHCHRIVNEHGTIDEGKCNIFAFHRLFHGYASFLIFNLEHNTNEVIFFAFWWKKSSSPSSKPPPPSPSPTRYLKVSLEKIAQEINSFGSKFHEMITAKRLAYGDGRSLDIISQSFHTHTMMRCYGHSECKNAFSALYRDVSVWDLRSTHSIVGCNKTFPINTRMA